MRTQEMFHLMQSGKEIRVALDTDGDRIGGLLNETVPMPVDEGEPSFDYRLHMKHLERQLGSALDHAVEAEDKHAKSLIRVSRLKGERDDSVNANHGKLVATRQGLESLYESGGFELAHVSGDTPRIPDKLLEQMGQTASLLRAPAVEPRQLKVEGFAVDLETVADNLESEVPDLRAKIGRFDRARKRAEGTKVAKDKALKALRRTVIWVGRTTEGLFYLAEEDELAKRIRSTTRRPQRPSEKAAAEASAEEVGSTDEPTSEPQTQATSSES